eukprot:1753001-Pyramimonas_sp.AAC.3
MMHQVVDEYHELDTPQGHLVDVPSTKVAPSPLRPLWGAQCLGEGMARIIVNGGGSPITRCAS